VRKCREIPKGPGRSPKGPRPKPPRDAFFNPLRLSATQRRPRPGARRALFSSIHSALGRPKPSRGATGGGGGLSPGLRTASSRTKGSISAQCWSAGGRIGGALLALVRKVKDRRHTPQTTRNARLARAESGVADADTNANRAALMALKVLPAAHSTNAAAVMRK